MVRIVVTVRVEVDITIAGAYLILVGQSACGGLQS